MNQNSGRTNISDILPQRCYGHFEKKPRWYHQDQKKDFYISAVVMRIIRNKKANVLISLIQESAHWQFKRDIYLILPG